MDVRRSNLSLILQEVRRESRSRARLAVNTGLTKATVSNLVSELASRDLVRVREPTLDGSIGRPSQLVELVPGRVLGLGLEINVDYVAAVVVDLAGDRVASERRPVDVKALSIIAAVAELASLADDVAGRVLSTEPGALLAGIGVAVPGLVDVSHGVVREAPNLGWIDVELRCALASRLSREGTAVLIDNDANLAALAEHRQSEMEGVEELLYLTGEVGIGGGVITGGRQLRGACGYAGEVGHMALDPDADSICGCGRRGCWETQCGLAAFLAAAADPTDPVRDLSLDLDGRLDLIIERARCQDPRTIEALTLVGEKLGIGASVLVNVMNTQVLVLGGYFARLGEFLLGPMLSQMYRRVIADRLGGCRIHLSRLGFNAAATGAALVVIEQMLADPLAVPVGSANGLTVTRPNGRSHEHAVHP